MKVIQGQFMAPNGTPAAGATLTLQLSQSESTSLEVIPAYRCTITLDDEGNIPAGTEVFANDEFNSLGSYYTITLMDPTYGRVLFERIALVGPSPINLSNLAPFYVQPE